MNWKKQFKKYFVQQMVLPALLLCLLGAVPASSTFCLLNNTTSVLTNTFDTYQAPYLVTYKPNGGYWVSALEDDADSVGNVGDVSVKDATETQYGHPTSNYNFSLLTQGKKAMVTFDGTSDNPKEYKLVYKGYELAGWSTTAQSPMNRSQLAEFKSRFPNSFFDTTYNITDWQNDPKRGTPRELYAVWLENNYTLANGIAVNNALRGNLSEAQVDQKTQQTYYLPASTVSLLRNSSSNNSAGRDSTITHVIFSVGTETGSITLPTTAGTGTHTLENVTEEQIKAQGYEPIWLDSNQQGYIRMYRVYHNETDDTISPATTPTAVCVAYVFASSPENGFVPDAILANRNCAYMFYGLTGLLKVGGITTNVDFSTTESMANMYAVCTNLRWQDMPDYESKGWTRINAGYNLGNVTTMQGMFMGCSAVETISFEKSNNFYITDPYGTKYYGTTKGNLQDVSHLFEGCTSLKQARFKNSVGNETTTAIGDYIDTSTVTTFANMFLGCRKLDTVDIQYIEVGSACTSLENMFNGCAAMSYKLELSNANIDTSNVKSFKGMYAGCEKMGSKGGSTVLDVSNFTISANAKDLSYMFAGCSSLTGIKLGDKDTNPIDTQNVTNFSYMFMGCSKLTTFTQDGNTEGVAVFDTQNAITLEGMFMSCSSLTTANIGGWKVDKVENFSNMFANCSSLTEVDSSTWQMGGGSQAAGIDISRAFMGCSNLKTVYVSDVFQNSVSNSKIVNSDMIFFGCMSLQGNLGVDENGAPKYTTYTEVMNASQHVGDNWIHNYGLTTDSMALFTDKSITVSTTTP